MPPELLSTLIAMHRQLATTGVLYMFACGVWGLVMAWRGHPMDANYRGILVIGYLLGDVISLLGLLLLFGGGMSLRDPLHVLYGMVAAVSLPLAAVYNQNRSNQRKPLLYALASFFVFGILIRGITTAGR